MDFENYIGIDWSGDKNSFQKGISISLCKNGTGVPKIIKPKEKYWSRSNLINWLNKKIVKEKSLIGFDFAFSYPFYDCFSYFPGVKESPINAKKLWSTLNIINQEKENFYGGEIWYKKPYSEFYNAPKLKGKLYCTRRRLTEIHAKNKLHSPSPTFNCVGPGSVGTGSLAGMRILNLYKNSVNIWPFDNYKTSNKSVFVEIFPTYYFRLSSVKPDKNIGYTLKNINKGLSFFNSKSLKKNYVIGGPDQDDADAIISSAALRYFTSQKDVWNVPSPSKKEGWIFGV